MNSNENIPINEFNILNTSNENENENQENGISLSYNDIINACKLIPPSIKSEELIEKCS